MCKYNYEDMHVHLKLYQHQVQETKFRKEYHVKSL